MREGGRRDLLLVVCCVNLEIILRDFLVDILRCQNLHLQLQVLKKAGCRKTFQEKVSGSAIDPSFDGCLLKFEKTTRLLFGSLII
jgi:hypothetical protein